MARVTDRSRRIGGILRVQRDEQLKTLLKSGTVWFTVLALTLMSGGVVLSWIFWDWLHPSSREAVSPSTTVRNVGILIGGLLALVFAVWRGWVAERQASTAERQADTAQQGLLDQRYHIGAEMLGSEFMFVRLAAIHNLEKPCQRASRAVPCSGGATLERLRSSSGQGR